MKTVHAVWEQRNMGVDCVEITIDRKDTPEDCREAIIEAETEYTVVKIPAGMAQMSLAVQEMGFRYMETMFTLRRTTELPQLPPPQQKLVESSDYVPMDEEGYKRLFQEIRDGMFKTDRVKLDPCFTDEQASERYVGWIRDEIKRGTEFFKLRYQGIDTGFFAFKKVREGVYLPFLAGIYPGGAKVFGLGYALCYMEIAEAHRRQARTITGSVSSNNIASLAALTAYGYIIDGASAVYVKHNR